MGKYLVHFGIKEGRETKSGVMVPVNYDFWIPLFSYFIKKCTHFRVDCWEDENEAIERAGIFGQAVDTDIDNMRVFQGQITDKFMQELLHNPFDKEGKIKWFSIFLMNGKSILFYRNIMEANFKQKRLTYDDVEYIRSTIPKDFTFYVC